MIDAAFGTGFRGTWVAPKTDAPVLAVDVPSGVDGLTGKAEAGVLAADRTVTFAALKPGLLFPPGIDLAGRVEVADIGLDVSSARIHLMQAVDVAHWLPARATDAHKWRSALWVIAGGGGMLGAAHLAVRAAQRAGAGMVRLSSPGVGADPLAPTEAVRSHLPATGWAADAIADIERFHAAVIGPGLGRADGTTASVREFVVKAPVPLVIDADGLFALAWTDQSAARPLAGRQAPTVITPHEGEFRAAPRRATWSEPDSRSSTTGSRPQGRGFAQRRHELSSRIRAATCCSSPTAMSVSLPPEPVTCWLASSGRSWRNEFRRSRRLPLERGFTHKRARFGAARGLVAGDLPDLLPQVLDAL